MKKELGMVGWPTKTFAINTIDLHSRDGGRVEWREAGRERDRKNRDKGKRRGLLCRQPNITTSFVRVVPLGLVV